MFIVSGASLIYCGLSDLAATFLLSSSIIQANHPKEEKEETETQVSKELEKALSTEVEGSESESTVFETE